MSSLLLFSILETAILSWPTPWSETRADADFNTPWGAVYSEERTGARENFFKGLETSKAEPEPEAYGIPEVQDEHAQGSEALDQLPWKQYAAKDQSLRFSRALLWPITNGRISSGYGVRGSGFHEGIDIPSPRGTSVRAAADGKIVFSGLMNGYGKTIVVYHGEGISSVYAHNSQNIRRVGEIVSQGDVVATVGQTGRARGSHLHFEIRRGGRAVNPLSYSYTRHPLLAVEARSNDIR